MTMTDISPDWSAGPKVNQYCLLVEFTPLSCSPCWALKSQIKPRIKPNASARLWRQFLNGRTDEMFACSVAMLQVIYARLQKWNEVTSARSRVSWQKSLVGLGILNVRFDVSCASEWTLQTCHKAP